MAAGSGRAPPEPPARQQTVRRQILACLRRGACTAAELSQEVRLPESEVRAHIDSMRQQVDMKISPPRCIACGFVFEGRRRARKPGKCPQCRSTRITQPVYRIEDSRRQG